MKVALHDGDGTKFPNLALMKLAAHHLGLGHDVDWFGPLFPADLTYSSTVFTFSQKNNYLPKDAIIGGTGSGSSAVLPENVEHIMPAYSFFRIDYSMGFTTRGCPRRCDFCVVPKKEGAITAHAEVEEFLDQKHGKLVLMDNNILAHDHGIKQIEKVSSLKVGLDINQGVDARLVDASIAKLFARVKWAHPVRLACDSKGVVASVRRAVELLRWHNVTPSRFFCYVLVTDDIDESVNRIMALKGMHLDVFAQSFSDPSGKSRPTEEQKRLARWVNRRELFRSTTWEEFKHRIKEKGKLSFEFDEF